ncbi:flagellar biosynthesis sigma factor [Pandoraea sp. PE-S2R-1]|uniref:flagellar biosynthesis sigma factor n=1 Tax=Pandoraea sp. PE-S2R-1 TaxID=1986994 RepID=UPI000B3FD200|nr:flagellar biosynthesis sigma factor [Pandoraea sp. PE-S2R-1]
MHRRFPWKKYTLWGLLALASAWFIYVIARPVDEVTLTIGEPYEHARQRSRSTLPPEVPGRGWFGHVTRPATLRFVDAQFGFVTPPAKFFAVMYDDHGKVSSLRLSPQVRTLLLDDAMAIVTDLQDQFERGGWRVQHYSGPHPRLDSPETRAAIEKNDDAPTTRWQADDKYQVSINIRSFGEETRPGKVRYLITIALSDVVFL